MHWQVQEAKQPFSEVLRAAEAGEPQIVTKHGEAVAVVIDIAEYRRLRGESMSFMDYLRVDAVADADIEVDRRVDLPRDVDLAGWRGVPAGHERRSRAGQGRARRGVASSRTPRSASGRGIGWRPTPDNGGWSDCSRPTAIGSCRSPWTS